jgi:hypothetical protein
METSKEGPPRISRWGGGLEVRTGWKNQTCWKHNIRDLILSEKYSNIAQYTAIFFLYLYNPNFVLKLFEF